MAKMIGLVVCIAAVYTVSCFYFCFAALRKEGRLRVTAGAFAAVASAVAAIWIARSLGSSYGVIELSFFALVGWAAILLATAVVLRVKV